MFRVFKKGTIGLLVFSMFLLSGFGALAQEYPSRKPIAEKEVVLSAAASHISLKNSFLKTDPATSLRENSNSGSTTYKDLNREKTIVREFEVTYPQTFSLKKIYNSEGVCDSSVGIYSIDGALIGGFIVNQPQENVTASDFEIIDNIIRLTIEKTETSLPVEYGVQKVAETYSDFFKSSKWITRDGKISLSITIKPEAFASTQGAVGMALVIGYSWNLIKARHQYDYNWYNEEGLKKQYDCHANYAFGKQPWNIEPWRPNSNYLWTVIKACNP